MDHSPGLAQSPFRAWFPTSLVVAATTLTLCDSSATRVFTWPWFPILQSVFLFPVGYLLVGRRSGKCPLVIDDLLAVAMAGFGAVGFLSAVHSEYRCLSIPFSAPYLFLASSYFAARAWIDRRENQERAPRLSILGHLVGVFIVLVILTSFAQWWWFDLIPALKNGVAVKATFRNGHPFGHSNYTAGFTTLALPWLVALAWKSSRVERLFWAGMVVLATALIASTGSRGGAIGLLVTLALFGGLTFWKASMSRRSRSAVVLSLMAVGVAVIWHEPRFRSLILNRRWDTIASESNRQREGMAEAGWLIGRENPGLGVGPGIVPYVYPRFRAQLSGGIEDVLQVHNTYLEIWAEMGIPGALLIALLALGSGKAGIVIIRKIKSHGFRDDLIFPLAGGIGLASYAVFAFTDHQLDLIAIALLLSIYFVFLREPEVVTIERIKPVRLRIWTESAILSFLSITILLFTWPNAHARLLFDSALDAWYAHDQNRFLQLGHEAAATAPWDTAYLNEIAGLMSENQTKPDSAAQAFVTEEIKACLQQSLRQDPLQEFPNFNLGWLALKTGDPSALAHFQSAAQLIPNKGGVYLGEALALLNQNRISEIPAALALEGLNDPSFLASTWWRLPDFKGLENVTRQTLDGFYLILEHRHSQLRQNIRYNQLLSNWLLGDPTANPALATDDMVQHEYFLAHRSSADLLAARSISFRNIRTGFPVLMRHADFPAPRDIYEVQENSLVFHELRYLFPAKGWLPTFELAALAQTAISPSNHVGTPK